MKFCPHHLVRPTRCCGHATSRELPLIPPSLPGLSPTRRLTMQRMLFQCNAAKPQDKRAFQELAPRPRAAPSRLSAAPPIRARPLKNKCTIQAETLRGNLPRLAPFIANPLSAVFFIVPLLDGQHNSCHAPRSSVFLEERGLSRSNWCRIRAIQRSVFAPCAASGYTCAETSDSNCGKRARGRRGEAQGLPVY